MPVGTVVGSVPSINPVLVPLNPAPILFLSGTSQVNIVTDGGTVSYVAGSLQGAADMLTAIHSIGAQQSYPDTVIVDHSSTLTFASVTPSTGTAGAVWTGDIAGTGFLQLGFVSIKAENGTVWAATINSTTDTDINLTFDGVPLTPAAIYTLYYSLDSGATWITTGLTITTS